MFFFYNFLNFLLSYYTHQPIRLGTIRADDIRNLKHDNGKKNSKKIIITKSI